MKTQSCHRHIEYSVYQAVHCIISLEKYMTVGRPAFVRNVSRSVAYKTLPGMKSPSIVMVPGLHSYTHMSGQKASCLLRCRLRNYNEALYVDD